MADKPSSEPIEPVLKLLCGTMIFFTGVLFAAEVWFQADTQLFQVIASILTGIVGAFMARIKPAMGATGPAGTSGPAGSSSDVSVKTETSISTEPKKDGGT